MTVKSYRKFWDINLNVVIQKYSLLIIPEQDLEIFGPKVNFLKNPKQCPKNIACRSEILETYLEVFFFQNYKKLPHFVEQFYKIAGTFEETRTKLTFESRNLQQISFRKWSKYRQKFHNWGYKKSKFWKSCLKFTKSSGIWNSMCWLENCSVLKGPNR